MKRSVITPVAAIMPDAENVPAVPITAPVIPDPVELLARIIKENASAVVTAIVSILLFIVNFVRKSNVNNLSSC